MHDSALHLPRSDSWPRLPVAIGRSARLDVLLFSGAAAIVALHALVDAFVAPEPGTGPRDHLLRGLASLALLALAAFAYPRLSAGGRAALAAVLGILSLEGAGLAIADARRSAPGARTGPASCSPPGGLLLVRSAPSCSGARASPDDSATCAAAAIALGRSLSPTGSSCRSRSGSSRRIARERLSSPPISAGPTRR